MKAAKDRREEFYDLALKDTVLGRRKSTWSCGKSTSKIHLLRWTKHVSAWKISIKLGSRPCGSKAMTFDRVVSDLMLPLWEEVLWPFLELGTVVCLTDSRLPIVFVAQS